MKNVKDTKSLGKIPPFARMDHRHLLDQNGELPFISSLSRKEKKKLQAGVKRIVANYRSILKQLATSGACFPVDQLLRQMVTEYTHRYASSGVSSQPVSFNYFEPFCHIKLINGSYAPYMELTEEFDHLFYAPDFFDYLTSADSDEFNPASLQELPENKTFHFSTNGDVMDISFLNAEGREFVISGFSMIRRGDSVHWYLLGGEVLDEEEWQLRCSKQPEIDIQNLSPSKRAFLSESIKENNKQVCCL